MVGISLSLGQSGNATILGGAQWWPDFSTLAADFPNNRYRVGNANASGTEFLNVTRASTGFAEKLDGSLATFSVNEPRRTNNGLLVEPSATNSLKNSQNYNGTGWSKVNTIIASDAALAPDGTMTADKITFTTTNSYMRYFGTATADMDVVGSIYLKGSGTLKLWFYANGGSAAGSLNIVLTDTWKRYDVPATFSPTATDRRFQFGVTSSYTATEVYAWGAQVEENRLTSYIKTESAAVTRPSDIVQAHDIATTLAAMSRAIIVTEFDTLEDYSGGNSHAYFSITDTAYSEWMEIQHVGNGKIRILVISGGVVTSFYLGGIRPTGHYKIAFGINSDGSYLASINGESSLSSTSTLTDLSVLTNAYIGATISGLVHAGSLNQLFLILDEDVSAARLEELSTL